MIVRALGLAMTALILNTAVAVAWLWFHSHALAPGQDPAQYQEYARTAVPIVEIVAGVPLLAAAGWLAAALSGDDPPVQSALLVVIFYTAVDLILLLQFGREPVRWDLAALSYATKLPAAAAGARLAARGGFAGPP